MKKIKTNIGYMYLPNESTVKTATVPFNETNSPKEINMIIITSADSKRLYRTANPYGRHCEKFCVKRNPIRRCP